MDYNDGKEPVSLLMQLVYKTVKNAFIFGYRVRFLHSLAYQLATLKIPASDIPERTIRILKTAKELGWKIWKSIKMGLDHGKVLAGFATVYRLTLLLLNRFNKKDPSDNNNNDEPNFANPRLENHFIAGGIGGFLVYSGLLTKISKKLQKRNDGVGSLAKLFEFHDGILTQITMYTLSRLILAVGRDISYQIADLLKVEYANNGNSKNKNISPQAIREIGWIVNCVFIWGGIMLYYRRDIDRLEKRKEYLQRALRVSLEFIYGGVGHAWKEAFDYGK